MSNLNPNDSVVQYFTKKLSRVQMVQVLVMIDLRLGNDCQLRGVGAGGGLSRCTLGQYNNIVLSV